MKLVTFGAHTFNLENLVRLEIHSTLVLTFVMVSGDPISIQLDRPTMERFLLWFARQTFDAIGQLPDNVTGIKKLVDDMVDMAEAEKKSQEESKEGSDG